MQSDHQFKALNGLAPFEAEGAMDDIRALFSLQSEVFTLLARRDAKIASLDDLKGKRVNVGNPGSGQRDTLDEIMRVKGWDKSVFALSAELKPAEQASALGDNNIDAMTYFVGHPNGAIQEATTTTDAVLVPVTGAEIDKLLAEKSYYTKAEIPGGVYKGNDAPTPSIGGKAVLSTTAQADPEVVYQLVKSVFDNLERFKRLHPAFADLKEADMIKVGLTAPLHDGAVRYYKERGWM
jgi:TRAP transporter TAXI family solute receptor